MKFADSTCKMKAMDDLLFPATILLDILIEFSHLHGFYNSMYLEKKTILAYHDRRCSTCLRYTEEDDAKVLKQYEAEKDAITPSAEK